MGRADEDAAPRLTIEVVHLPEGAAPDCRRVELAAGATLADAIAASGIVARLALDAERLVAGIWGRPCGADTPLRDGDRVEIYRPLKIDPKEARRRRVSRSPRR